MSEFPDQEHIRRKYDAATGMMISTEQSMKAAHDRALYEFREWYNSKAAPPEGYGIDGYPLQTRKEATHERGV